MSSPSLEHPSVNTSVRLARGEAAGLWIHRSLVSLLLFALFGECLYPLYSIVIEYERTVIDVFLCLTGALLLVGSLRLGSWLQAALQLMLIGVTFFYLFGLNEGISWFQGYGEIAVQDIVTIFQTGRLSEASPESRMLLLLIGWALLVVSVQMLAVGRQTILLFLSVTIIYLLIIEMIFDAPIFYNLVRAAGIGLWIQCYTFALQLGEKGYVKAKDSNPVGKRQGGRAYTTAALLTVMGIVILAVALCIVLPIQPNQQQPWQALVKSLQSWSEGASSVGASRTASSSVSGYGRDDGELGAPLELRWDTYFTAESPMPLYWRGESKSLYTGRGWLNPAKEGNTQERHENEATLLPQDDEVVNGMKIRQTITFQRPIFGKLPLFSGGIPLQVDRVFTRNAQSIPFEASINQSTGAIYLEQARQLGRFEQEQATGVQGYELTISQLPTAGGHLRHLQGDDPASIMKEYTQLPERLPDRVRDLGKLLVQDTDNRYDATMAVANYLKQQYSYNLSSAIPPTNEDFVDRFLFVDRQGYCDHFSTAMVVLLRSSEIPARWVKGFAPGERNKEEPNSYTVRYADAHAWVEVYFPGHGWVSFDPTPGYESVVSAANGAGGLWFLRSWLLEAGQRLEGLPTAIKIITDQGVLILRGFVAKAPVLWTAALLAVWPAVWIVTWVAGNVYIWRNLFLLWWITAQPRSSFPDQRLLLHAADRVWQQLYRVYGYKPEGMTAREYLDSLAAEGIENFSKLEEFVRYWETLYYGGLRPDRMNSRNFLELCRNLTLRRG
ncbi:transglutaminase-like domain-containing protein [Paenibacillus lentus]|uniref:Transglutaminase domain-containing protein n=1 Tax=Paenibacillus lentus TaxID=1338368 RepID=A0A3S8RPE6_9BACL|nr:transglutaminase-like domain-containing protein [Paenibacillus lentus]AZK44808.1 transglutaminase domain-containing protein [Paenibacillus lentus]